MVRQKAEDKMNLVQIANNKKLVESTSVVTILGDIKKKDVLEKKAFDALERRLEPKDKICRKCSGEGTRADGLYCGICEGNGFVREVADMRAIELVLKPKFPTTQINLNADIDGMSVKDLLGVIDKM